MISYLIVIGILLSIYILYVKRQISKNPEYKSICDINEVINCKKVVTNKYSKTYYIENGILGIAFYLSVYCGYLLRAENFLFYLSIAGFGLTVYLSLKLYEIKRICPVCVVIHIINIIFFWITFQKFLAQLV